MATQKYNKSEIMKGMKVNYKAGTCSSREEMDIESRQSVHLAEHMVDGKRGVLIGNERVNSCTLEIYYGRNIYSTQIFTADRYGLAIAFYYNGYFYDSISKQKVELF